MGPPSRDTELVRRYLDSGDLRYFDELVVRYRDRVMRLVLSVLGPEWANDAEDVVQEAFLRAHDRLAGFRGESRFGTWLYRVAYNRALDHRRAAGRRARRARESVEDPASAQGVESSAGQRLLSEERGRSVRTALERVPQPYRAALHSYYWLELPVAEIAELLGVAPGTVKSYLHRGRARLARLLSEGGPAR